MAAKTSTFTIHHDRCKPETWTPGDILKFARFVETGNLQYAAALSKLGVQLVVSEHHVPVGGTLEHIGWAHAEVDPSGIEGVGELSDVADDEEITPVCKIYRGPAEYAVRYTVDDGHGEYGGTEHEVKATEAEATEFLKSLTDAAVDEAAAL